MRTDFRSYVLAFAVASLLALPVGGGAGTVPPKQAVRVDSISPTAAHRGDTVTVRGANFGGQNVRIAVAGVPASLVSASGSVATFRVPAGAPFGHDTVRVTEPGGTWATIGLEVDYDGQATIVTDDAHAVVAEIGPAGGTLQHDGLTLTIPAGALLDSVQITMTPLLSLSGTPFDDSLIAGAQFAPDGLLFLLPATLTMPLPSGVDPADVLGFAGDAPGDGTIANLHLTPSVVSNGVILVPLSHFSTGGASSGGASAAAAASTYTPSTVAEQAKQAIAGLLNQSATDSGPQIAVILLSWYNNAVRPGLVAAGNLDEPDFEQAVHDWQDWLYFVETLGDLPAGCCPLGPPTVRATLQPAIDDAQKLALDDAVYLARILLARCTGFVDFHQPLRDVIRLAATVQTLELPIESRTFPDGSPVPAGNQLAHSCVHVQLEQTTHAPAFAINTANTFTARWGVTFWDGTTRHDLPVDVRLADTTNGPPVLIDMATITNGQWQTTITPSTVGLSTYQFNANLSGINAAEVGAGEHFDAQVRDRIELQAKRAQDTTFADTIGPVQAGKIVTLRVRLAGDGMAFGTFALTNSGAGTLGASSGVTDQQGEALVTYTAPASSGSDTITATVTGSSDTLTITIQAAVSVSVTPASITLAPGGQTIFTASVTGASNQTVTWTTTGGTITSTGLYTAPSTPGTYSVTATSVDDPSQSQTVAVTVMAANPTLPFLPGHYHGGSSSPFTPAGVPADIVQDCTAHGGVVLIQTTFDYQITDTGQITGTLGIDATLTPSGPLTLIGQSGNITVQVTRVTSSQIVLDLQGTSQVLGAFCGRFTLAGIQILYRFGLDSVSIGLNFVGP